VRNALGLTLDELPPLEDEEPESAGALPISAAPELAPPPAPAPPPPTPKSDDPETPFFEGPKDDDEFEVTTDNKIPKAAWVSIVFGAALVIGGVAVFGFRDRVTPLPDDVGKPELSEANWHEDALKKAQAGGATAPLDTEWRAREIAPARPAPSAAPTAASTEAAHGGHGGTQAHDGHGGAQAHGGHGGAPAHAASAPPPATEAPTQAPTAPASKSALEDLPTEPAPAVQAQFRALFDDGLKLHERRKYRDALDRFENALALAPANETLLLAYAQTLLEAGRKDDALRAVRKVVTMNAESARGWLLVGSIEQERGAKTEAAQAYRNYLRIAPTDKYADDVRRVMENFK
jgi:hypothetical protein